MNKKDLIKIEFDPANPPPLTGEQKAELERIAALPDEAIDTSDIPEADEDFWSHAERNRFFRPLKQQLTLRLDADLIAWFKARSPNGRGYQTAINRALRQHVENERRRTG
jgi:uncharacterized protein (DUF4415 family)